METRYEMNEITVTAFATDNQLLREGCTKLFSDTFKVVFIARYIFKQLQTKCKTCFGGPRMILHAN